MKKEKCDLIVATELFEHVRDPLKLVKRITYGLKTNGLLIDSMGGVFDRKIGGDHLKESIKIGNSKKYKKYYNKNFRQIKMNDQNLNYLFRKIS